MSRLPITGVILAGGQGRRMGSVDKGLQVLRGKPMVQHVLERFTPQVDEVLINANQNIEQYQTLGHPVVPDEIGGYAGPLAGLHRGLSVASHDLIATVPCDSPFLPLDLIARLYTALDEQQADLAVARTGDQPHPVFCLTRKSVLPGLTSFLESGGRKIDAWYSVLKVAEVRFDDEAEAFSNINTVDELRNFDQTEFKLGNHRSFATAQQTIIAAHKNCSKHRKEIEASDLCGCFYCTATFKPIEISEWVDWPADTPSELEKTLGTTAICPRCGIDSVIGSASGFPLTIEFLTAMHRHWF